MISLSRPTRLTQLAIVAIASALTFTAVFLTARYPALPDLLPVHFQRNGVPNGWQYKTPWRVLLPLFVEAALAATLGAIALLLLSRSDHRADTDVGPYGESGTDPRCAGELDEAAPAHLRIRPVPADVQAAATAAEAVMLITAVWVVFQAYAAIALAAMWQRERGGLGAWYTRWEFIGVVLTVAAAVRAHRSVGRPEPRPFVAEHWRFGQLYKNASDPALFVPTRDGARWTLNFGRPVAAALMGLILAVGMIGPTVILGLLLR